MKKEKWFEFFSVFSHWFSMGSEKFRDRVDGVIGDAIERIKPHAKKIRKRLIFLSGIIIQIPILAVLLDFHFRTNWITTSAGIFLALILLFFLLSPKNLGLAALLGAIWSILHFQIKPTFDEAVKFGEGYVKFVLYVILWELAIVFYLSIFKVWNNPKAIPIVALCALLLPLMASLFDDEERKKRSKFFKKLAFRTVTLIFIIETLTFVLPTTAETIRTKIPLDQMLNGITESVIARVMGEKETKEKKANGARVRKRNNPKPKPPPRRLTGTFHLKADEEIQTGLSYKRGDYIEYRQDEPKKFFIRGSSHDIKVNQKQYLSQGTIGGEVWLKGGSEPTVVRVRIIPPKS